MCIVEVAPVKFGVCVRLLWCKCFSGVVSGVTVCLRCVCVGPLSGVIVNGEIVRV